MQHDAVAKMPASSMKTERLHALLEKFRTDVLSRTNEKVRIRVSKYSAQELEKSKTDVNYGDICIKYELNLLTDNEEFLAVPLAAGYITRKPLPKAQVTKLEAAKLPKSAHFMYFVTGPTQQTLSPLSRRSIFALTSL